MAPTTPLQGSPTPTVLHRWGVRMSGRHRDERGQVIVLGAVMIPVLLLLAALVIDVGNWYTHKRQLQNRADAAAFALPSSTAEAGRDACKTGTSLSRLSNPRRSRMQRGSMRLTPTRLTTTSRRPSLQASLPPPSTTRRSLTKASSTSRSTPRPTTTTQLLGRRLGHQPR